MANGDFKDLPRRTASDKVLCNKSFNIAKNLKYNGYQRGFASMAYKIFEKNIVAALANKSSAAATHTGTGVNSDSENQSLAEELH